MARKEEYHWIRVGTPDRSYAFAGTEKEFDKEIEQLEKQYPESKFEFDTEWNYSDEEDDDVGTTGESKIEVDFKSSAEGDKYYKKLAKFYNMPSSKK